MPDYEETYNAVMSLPCVQRLIKKNKKLRKENKSLRNLIQLLPEFRNQPCSINNDSSTSVPIKIEKKTQNETTQVNLPLGNIDSEVEIVVPTVDFKENIVYDIIEESSETTAEEEEEDFGIDNERVETLIKEDESRLYLFKRLEKEVEEE